MWVTRTLSGLWYWYKAVEIPHLRGNHWNMKWQALFGFVISCVLVCAPARISASSEAGENKTETERYKLVVFDFDRVELPFVICLWILIVALAKIGTYTYNRIYSFKTFSHIHWGGNMKWVCIWKIIVPIARKNESTVRPMWKPLVTSIYWSLEWVDGWG